MNPPPDVLDKLAWQNQQHKNTQTSNICIRTSHSENTKNVPKAAEITFTLIAHFCASNFMVTDDIRLLGRRHSHWLQRLHSEPDEVRLPIVRSASPVHGQVSLGWDSEDQVHQEVWLQWGLPKALWLQEVHV